MTSDRVESGRTIQGGEPVRRPLRIAVREGPLGVYEIEHIQSGPEGTGIRYQCFGWDSAVETLNRLREETYLGGDPAPTDAARWEDDGGADGGPGGGGPHAA